MAFQLSPGVNISEIDLTTTVPGTATSIGGIAGHFPWGPVDKVLTMGSEVELVNTFLKPNSNNAEQFFSAANFLSYSNNLKTIRVASSSVATNAHSNGATGAVYFIPNDVDYENNYTLAGPIKTHAGPWIAKYPGSVGNSLEVYVLDSGNYSANAGATGPLGAIFQDYAGEFDSAPNTSNFALSKGLDDAKDELHVLVVDKKGLFSGTPGTLLEKFSFMSKFSDAKTESGESSYYVDVINRQSRYIWWNAKPSLAAPGELWGLASTAFDLTDEFKVLDNVQFDDGGDEAFVSFVNGADDYSSSLIANNGGYNLFVSDSQDVNLIIAGSASVAEIKAIVSIAENRGDCVAFFSPEKSDVVNNVGDEADDVVDYVRNTINVNSSYAFADGNWKYQYDKYNDLFRWIPCNGDVAGLCARTDLTNDPWFSPAGYNRGILKNVIKLAWNPDKADRDALYKNSVNPIISEPGVGTVLFGDKTTLARPSAFSRINVRRLFNVLKKSIGQASKFSLFELNDEFTREQFVGLVEPFLRDVQGRRGIIDFKVVCDETNNTPQVIDSNSFVGDIYIKPARSINFIQLNFVAVRTGVEFNEIVGQF
jgi:hypothetical protein